MTAKQIDVTCPCCSTRITVDVATAQVLRHVRPEDVDEQGRTRGGAARWDSARERVRDRSGRTDEVLDQALSDERRRRASFDDLFRAASDKARRPPDEGAAGEGAADEGPPDGDA
jgi:hypothetical protein